MAKQSQITIPLTTFPIVHAGPFSSPTLPSTLNGYMVDLTNNSSWPATGDVLTIQVDVSSNNGASWLFDASITLSGGQWKDSLGANSNSASWNVTIPNSGSTTRKMRVTLDVLQICTLGATISTL